MNRSIFASLVLLAGLFLLTSPASAQETGTWTGEIVDLACYEQSGAINDNYRACIEKGVKNGQPMGIILEGNTLVVLAASGENPKAYKSLSEKAYGPVLKGGVVFEIETTVTSKDAKGRTVIEVSKFKMLR